MDLMTAQRDGLYPLGRGGMRPFLLEKLLVYTNLSFRPLT